MHPHHREPPRSPRAAVPYIVLVPRVGLGPKTICFIMCSLVFMSWRLKQPEGTANFFIDKTTRLGPPAHRCVSPVRASCGGGSHTGGVPSFVSSQRPNIPPGAGSQGVGAHRQIISPHENRGAGWGEMAGLGGRCRGEWVVRCEGFRGRVAGRFCWGGGRLPEGDSGERRLVGKNGSWGGGGRGGQGGP
jgi:hypothetical protein